ncbi:hypothetical protein DM785_02685 [Deinococcus actinosclerus]|nr:hypothetical protein DM785_02685 [Deinococcus actinosclerus]
MRYGFRWADLRADPRPSHIRSLLGAARVADARLRLEDWEDTLNLAGVEGDTVKVGGKQEPPPKERIIPVGFNRRRAELEARAYPELAAGREEQRRAAQQQKKKSFWTAVGAERAVAIRMRDGEVIREPTDDQHG